MTLALIGTATAADTPMGRMQGGSPPPDARDPHAYAEGTDFGPMRPHFADEANFGSLLADRFEAVRTEESETGFAWDIQAWYGRDYDRLVLKAEGETEDGRLAEATTEILWGHAVAPFWDIQLGLRQDNGGGAPSRRWLALGIQGLAPYWFELDLTAYAGNRGRVAFGLEAEYEWLFTQRLILQPRLEMNAYGQRDVERSEGAGLSDATFGLRLRYELRRELAPYVGVEWIRQYGETAELTRAGGGDPRTTRFVTGIRFWF